MPPKPKLYKTKMKSKCVEKKPVVDQNAQSNLEEDSQSQFEVELCWCIQQLQHSIRSGKLNTKQTQDATKTMNTLMSNSAPLIKKRQLMRMTFGDYRAKMLETEKKISKVNSQIKLSAATPSPKSMFVKKALFMRSENSFKFNFKSPEDQATQEINKLSIETSVEKDKTDFHFQHSDNSFRFNFNAD